MIQYYIYPGDKCFVYKTDKGAVYAQSTKYDTTPLFEWFQVPHYAEINIKKFIRITEEQAFELLL